MSINVEIDVDGLALGYETQHEREERARKNVKEHYQDIVKKIETIIEKKYDEIGSTSGLGVFERLDLMYELGEQKKRAFARLSELRMEQTQTLEPVVTQPRDTGVFRPQPSVKTIGASL